jgi:hypothetical protein
VNGRILYVIAARRQFFVDWCAEHGVNPHDRSFVHVHPGAHGREFLGTRGAYFTVATPGSHDPDVRDLVIRALTGFNVRI